MVNFKLEKRSSSIAPPGAWSNKDTDPTLPDERIWGMGTIMLYWMSDVIGVSAWQTASSIVAVGVSWRHALVIKALGGAINGLPLVLNGRLGSKYHVPFPILVRASHGFQFSKFPIVSRVIVAMFWFAINSYNGGSCVKSMLYAIWPSFRNLHNSLPVSAGTNTQSMVAYILYWLIQFPFIFIHPRRMKPLFIVKAVYVPIVAICTLAWSCHKAGGISAIDRISTAPPVTGQAFASAWLLALSSTVGSYSTLALNIPDFTRYTAGPGAVWIQWPFLPFLYVLNGIFGIFGAASTQVWHGSILWSPLDIANQWTSRGGRAAAFFAATGWLIANLSNNISANSVSAANDLATLFPQYLDIRRGQILVAIVACWAMVPWKILSSGSVFLNFISGYALVLGPFCAIMICDYYIVKGRTIDVPALYDPKGRYTYNKWGTNWRALVTIFSTIAPALPGLARVLSPTTVHIGKFDGINWIYSVSWIFTFTTSCIMYTALHYFFPVPSANIDHDVLSTDCPQFQEYMKEHGIPITTGDSASASDEEEKKIRDATVTPVLVK